MISKNLNEEIFASSSKREPLKLKSKNQSVTFRIASPKYLYEGLHFEPQEGGKFKVSHCPRVESNEFCLSCDMFFKAKEDKDENGMKAWKATVNVYYMVLDRSDSSLKLLQTTIGTKKKIDQYLVSWKQANKNYDDFDLKLTRTENPGADYYNLVQVDSSISPKLTEDETRLLKDAKDMDLLSFATNTDKIEVGMEALEEF